MSVNKTVSLSSIQSGSIEHEVDGIPAFLAANASSEAYNNPSDRVWDLGSGYYYDTLHSTENIAVYRQLREGGNVIVAHRGTDLAGDAAANDLMTDVMIGLGFGHKSKYMREAEIASELIQNSYSKSRVTHVGHSLGGYIANYVTQYMEKKGFETNSIVFNPGSGASPARNTLRNILGKKQGLGRHVIYRHRNDVISLNSKFGFFPGDEVLEVTDAVSNVHSLKQFVNK